MKITCRQWDLFISYIVSDKTHLKLQEHLQVKEWYIMPSKSHHIYDHMYSTTNSIITQTHDNITAAFALPHARHVITTDPSIAMEHLKQLP